MLLLLLRVVQKHRLRELQRKALRLQREHQPPLMEPQHLQLKVHRRLLKELLLQQKEPHRPPRRGHPRHPPKGHRHLQHLLQKEHLQHLPRKEHLQRLLRKEHLQLPQQKEQLPQQHPLKVLQHLPLLPRLMVHLRRRPLHRKQHLQQKEHQQRQLQLQNQPLKLLQPHQRKQHQHLRQHRHQSKQHHRPRPLKLLRNDVNESNQSKGSNCNKTD
ncbi:PAX-interacting protein 1-like [Bombyx mandarina]|uniref:PAX-interacting protein 1-like n=1 Tax=Bombyx mandarina TaxID=7092 RepID=A0A6J2KL72_BOMMA|nr:PAX-interacting protein 1-like [Bombyx mandarina]